MTDEKIWDLSHSCPLQCSILHFESLVLSMSFSQTRWATGHSQGHDRSAKLPMVAISIRDNLGEKGMPR